MKKRAARSAAMHKLIESSIVKRRAGGAYVPTAATCITIQDHHTILQFYNSKMRGILSFCNFGIKLASMAKIAHMLKMSCALTLALKYKLRTARKAFGKFGPNLKCGETGLEFEKPDSFKVTHRGRGPGGAGERGGG